MDTVARLIAIEEIKRLKARYFRYMDTKDWKGLRTVFCDDAVFDARAALSVDASSGASATAESGQWVYRGGGVIAQFIEGAIGTSVSVHHGHCHEIEIHSPHEASGVIAMEDRIWDRESMKVILHGSGHYLETYRCVNDEWRIYTSKITRLFVLVG